MANWPGLGQAPWRDDLKTYIDASDPINAKNNGAVGDGSTDDTSAIQDTIDAVPSTGGTIYFPVGVYVINGTLDLTDRENVRLIGAGAQNAPYYGAPTKGTVFKRLSGTGSMLSWMPTVGSANSLRGCGIEGIAFDGNALADTCLDLRSIYAGTFRDIMCRGATSVQLNLSTVDCTGVEDLQACIFEHLMLNGHVGADAAKGLVLNGSVVGGGNVSANTFINCFVYTKNGTGIEFGYSDTNRFYSALVNRSGTASAIEFLASNSSGSVPWENVFYSVDTVGPIIARGTPSGTYPSRDNSVFFSAGDAPSLVPIIEPGATLHWSTTHGVRWPEYRQLSLIEDDFMGGLATSGQIGKLGWATAGGTVTQLAGVVSHPGIIRLDTGSSAGTLCRVFMFSNGTGMFNCQEAFDITFYIRMNQNDTDTMVRCGLMSATSLDPSDAGLYVEKVYADTSWYGVTRSSDSQTRSAALASTSTDWTTIRIRRIWPDCAFSVNGSAETIITNSSTMPGGALQPVVQIKNQSGQKTVDFDYYSQLITGLTRA